MVFRKYTLGRYRETLTMIKIQTTIKKSECTVLGLRPSSDPAFEIICRVNGLTVSISLLIHKFG